MTIQDLVSIVLSRIKLIILFTLLGGVIAFSVAEFLMPLKYSSNVSLYVKSSTDTNATGTATAAQLDTAKSLASTYIVILKHKSVYEKISEKFMEEYDVSQLEQINIPLIENKEGKTVVSPSYISSCVSISTVDDTEVLNIAATTEHPEISADICNYMAEVAPDILKRVIKAGSVETISPAEVPTQASSPNKKRVTLIGAFIGFIISLAIAILISLFNNKVTTGAEIKEKFGVPILAEIPTFDSKLKKGAYKQ